MEFSGRSAEWSRRCRVGVRCCLALAAGPRKNSSPQAGEKQRLGLPSDAVWMSLSDGVSQTAVLEQRAVRARNFPAAWVQPAAISALPQKAQVLLQRIGEIGQTPVVVTGPHGPEVIANFKTATAAREAARRLHGTDLRTDAEKKAVDYQPAKEHERFWLQLVEPGSVTAAAAASVVRGAKIAKPKKCTVGNGLILSPLPPTWAEKDVMVLVQPYGQTLS
eukprot:1606839-Amphidinium_carterae.1